jgi:predicted CoA-binding protein
MNKTTLVIGASTNPDRYSFKAIRSLVHHGYTVHAYGLRPGVVDGISIDTERVAYSSVHTVSLYVGPDNQPPLYDYIESLHPARVIFNPGTENELFAQRLQTLGIEATEACTLVLLSTGQF